MQHCLFPNFPISYQRALFTNPLCHLYLWTNQHALTTCLVTRSWRTSTFSTTTKTKTQLTILEATYNNYPRSLLGTHKTQWQYLDSIIISMREYLSWSRRLSIQIGLVEFLRAKLPELPHFGRFLKMKNQVSVQSAWPRKRRIGQLWFANGVPILVEKGGAVVESTATSSDRGRIRLRFTEFYYAIRARCVSDGRRSRHNILFFLPSFNRVFTCELLLLELTRTR